MVGKILSKVAKKTIEYLAEDIIDHLSDHTHSDSSRVVEDLNKTVFDKYLPQTEDYIAAKMASKIATKIQDNLDLGNNDHETEIYKAQSDNTPTITKNAFDDLDLETKREIARVVTLTTFVI